MHQAFLISIRLILTAAIALTGTAAEQPFSGQLVLNLDGALAQNFKAETQDPVAGRDLELHVTCENGVWGGVWGFASDFNVSIHLGEVVRGEVASDAIRLALRLDIARDNWITGGSATYEVAVTRRGDQLTGTVNGVFQGEGAKPWQVKDRPVSGSVLPLSPLRPGFTPVKPGEHPRLLFRKSDLPALRERAATPFGKAALEQLKAANDPVALGVLFQLTGDASYAARAWPETVKVMDNRNGGAFALGRFWGYRTMVVANAYDLCQEAWTKGQREQVENYLDEILDLCLNRKHRVGTVNWAPGSNYTVVIHSGNGAAALALWGGTCPAPAEPLAPRMAAARITPEAGFAPGAQVPVVPLPVGRTSTEWLWLGPFNLHVSSAEDCLAAVGGAARVRPTAGDTVAFREQTLAWQPLSQRDRPEAFVDNKAGPAGYGLKDGQIAIATPKLAGGEQKRLFFYAMIENPKDGWFRFKANFWNGVCYIGGERILDGEVFHLAAGRHAWMVPVIIGAPTGHASPFFVEVNEQEAAAYFADESRVKAYAAAKSAWDRDLAAWKANGGVNQIWLRNVRTLEAWNYLNLQRGMGDGGFQGEGEGYTIECHHMPHDFAVLYQNVMGRALTGRPDISHFAARYVHAALWNGKRPFQQSYGGHGGGTLPAYYFARSIVLAPEAWRPVLLDHWLRLAGTTHEQVVAGPGVAALCAERGHDDALTLPLVFLNFPLEMRPQGTEGILPRAWAAQGRGYFSFRNGWKGDGDIIASVYAKQGVSCGWNQSEAGCFQIFGLGREWAYKSNDAGGKVGSRWLDNVVMLPDDPIRAGARARVLHASADENGSGVVSIDMDPLYQLADSAKSAPGKPKGSVGKDKDAAIDEAIPPAEAWLAAPGAQTIRGLRSFAVDYSGRSGAPGLFAVADRITGGGRKIWVFQQPRDPKVTVTIDGPSFTLSDGDASLRATFIGAPGISISRASGVQRAHPGSGIQDVASSAIHATIDGGSGGEFFVVFTLQKGPPPVVKFSGIGLAATVNVGSQSIRFLGDRLVLGR